MQLRNHVDTQPVKRLCCKSAQEYEILLRNWSGGTAHLPT